MEAGHDERRLVAKAVQQFGDVDIAVSNVSVRPYQAFLDITVEDWDRVLIRKELYAFSKQRLGLVWPDAGAVARAGSQASD